MDDKLYIAMVGLPARGKSTVALKLKETLEKDCVAVRIFNNGDVRRRMLRQDTSHAGFYDPDNVEAVAAREVIALINVNEARDYLAGTGKVAILDATNVRSARRQKIKELCNDHPILFVECHNDDEELVAASIARKARLPEFAHLAPAEAMRSFRQRIGYYERIADPIESEERYVAVDSLNNRILKERVDGTVPYYAKIRDMLVSDWVKNLFLVRHGETYYNLEERLGGDSPLTRRGQNQARQLADHFQNIHLPYVFISTKRRTWQMAEPLFEGRPDRMPMALDEFDEIDAGVCEDMTYDEVRDIMPDVFAARAGDKYNYIYPGGEGYATLKDRVYRGVKKALYLSGNADNIMIVGHQAVNRMILAHFLFRRTEDVPYTYIPQDRYFHIVSTQTKKLFQLVAFAGCVRPVSQPGEME